MRTLLALVVALGLAGCTRSNGLFIGGGDGATESDLGLVDLAGADLHRGKDGGGDVRDLSQPPADDLAGGPICSPVCDHCTTGACCPGGKNGCCNPGEYCDATGRCRCGGGDACTGGLICASGGPISGGGQCGSVCCGDFMHPCPL